MNTPRSLTRLLSELRNIQASLGDAPESEDAMLSRMEAMVNTLWKQTGGTGKIEVEFTDLAIMPGDPWQGLLLKFGKVAGSLYTIRIDRRGLSFEMTISGIHGGPRSLDELTMLAEILTQLASFAQKLLTKLSGT